MRLKESSASLSRAIAPRERTGYAVNTLVCALAGCIALILFSSTSVAGRWSDQGFDDIYVFVLIGLAPHAPPYALMHMTAEKGLHCILFGTLGMLLWRIVPNRAGKIWLILASGAVVGMGSEVLQMYFPHRDPMVKDVILNVAAAAMGMLFVSGTSLFRKIEPTR